MRHATRGGWILVGWLAVFGLAQAAMYKWVDEKGVTQYSQFPPPNRKAQVMVPPPPPAEDPEGAQKKLEATLQKLDEEHKAKTTAAEEKQKAAETAKQRQQACQAARDNLEKLTTGGRKRIMGADGVASYMPEEERQKQITLAKDAIKKYCD